MRLLSPEKTLRAVCKKQLATYLSQEAIDEIYQAFYFAEKAHRGQQSRTGEAYINYPIAVARTLAELRMDSHSIIAALLHDVIEDTDACKEEIESKFGAEVALLVDGASKIRLIQFNDKKQAEAENYRKMLMAMSEDVRVMIVKLADRLQNMRTLEVMPSEKQRRISSQTLDIYAPIAERLGLYHWARELQDLCFQYLYPKRHRAIGLALKQREGNRKKIVEKLRVSFTDTLNNAGIKDFEVKGRRKTAYSIYKKMLKKKHSFKELHDIYGFRIIVSSVDECYRVLGVVHNGYKPIPGRFADYIAIPKANGYQSLHTVVFGPFGENIEVQIRTTEMNQVAESGVAAHWAYKSDSEESNRTNHLARQWLLDLLDPSNQTGSPVEFLEHLKTDLYPDKVYVFTPKGDIKKMPRGSTALDFAYAVHTDVGTHCTGARINRILVTLPTVLKNGDQVEIITAKNSWPNVVWLNYAVTAKARAHIRHYLKTQTKEDALKLGKRLLAGATKQRLLGRNRISQEVQSQLLSELDLASWSDLLIDIGLGNRLPDLVARQIGKIKGGGTNNKLVQNETLVIKGSEGLLVTYARCCCPIPDDPIFGTFTAGHGLVIHTTDCPNTTELRKHPERCLMVEWDENLDQYFFVKIQVRMRHKKDVFAKAASVIAECESNINNVELLEGSDQVRQVDFLIDVKDRVHLAKVIKIMRKQKNIVKVMRLKG